MPQAAPKVGNRHKGHRSATHRAKGKYERQKVRTAVNKGNRARSAKRRREERMAAGTWRPYNRQMRSAERARAALTA